MLLNLPGLERLSRHALHHAVLDDLKLKDGNKLTVGTALQENTPITPFRGHAHLVVVSSLLDELVDYFLSLSVTFLLQVSDECVQMAWTIIRLHYGLMSLNHTGNTCKHTFKHERSPGNTHTHTQSHRASEVLPHPPAAASECLQTPAMLSSPPGLLLWPRAGSLQL